MPKEKINHAVRTMTSVGNSDRERTCCGPGEGCDKPDCSGSPVILPDARPVAWTPQPGEVGPGAWLGEQDTELAVGWHKDSYVQLSIEADVRYLKMVAETPDGADSDRSSVYTVPLSRFQVNQLIKTLRRAREAAFGRDE